MKIQRKHLLIALAVIFCIFEAVMFYLIHIENMSPDHTLHYGCVIGAAVFSWLTLLIEILTAKYENEDIKKLLLSYKDGNLLRIAMLFTLLADYFLVAMDEENNLAGVSVFIGTQLFIFLHIMAQDKNPKWRAANITARIILSVALIITAGLILGRDTDPLSLISVVYYANLLVNAFFAHRIGRGGIMLTIGLVLFAMCDINVGLSALEDIYNGGFTEGSLLYLLSNTEADLIWLFYIPSQTLIPLSLLSAENYSD